jgi:hypothetical protein
MRLILLLVTLTSAAGLLAGGRLRHIPQAGVRWGWLAVIGLGLQLAPFGYAWRAWAMALLYCSFALLVAFAVRNLRHPGFVLILVGLALNVAVIAPNAGMPVSPRAMELSDQREDLALVRRDGDGVKHHLSRDSDVLPFLGDVIPLPPPIRLVISVGDIFVHGGAMWFLFAAMRPARRGGRVGRARPTVAARGS